MDEKMECIAPNWRRSWTILYRWTGEKEKGLWMGSERNEINGGV